MNYGKYNFYFFLNCFLVALYKIRQEYPIGLTKIQKTLFLIF